MSNDPLLQPFQLKHLTLRNRILLTSHEPAYAEDGMPKAAYRAYHVARAKAGVAMTMTAGSASVSRDSPPAFNNILAWKDEVVGWMRALADECHGHGAAVMIQLTHLGRRTRWDRGDWLPVPAPGRVPEPAHRTFSKLMEDWDIDRIVQDYADAAERMKAAGLDGIELESYGHLLDQFWSPLTNDLDPPWNGSLENRMRFSLRVLQAIRSRVGPDFIVGVRYSGDDMTAGGIGPEEGMAITRALKDSGLVDFLNVIRGYIASDPALTTVIPVQGMPSAPHLDFAGGIRAATGMPVFHAARIPDVATARHAIASGKLDMVGMTRAHLADPLIVRKIIEGREEDIRPCVGANFCLDRIYQGGIALCTHNPATGRELDWPQEIPAGDGGLSVVVVGAGPGGLEAARVAATRGHRVTVVEAAAQAGGQVRLAAQTARRREVLGVVRWREEQCAKLGVTFRFNTLAEADTVLALAPDVVIVATGGLPMMPRVAGDDLCVTGWDILSGDAAPGAEVLVYDEAGDFTGLQAAETVAEAGGRVEVVTADRSFAPEVMGMSLTPYVRALQAHGARFTVTWRLKSVRREGNRLVATLGSDYGPMTEERRVDQVVLNHGTAPLDELYFALKPLSRNLGQVDYAALVAGQRQGLEPNPEGRFRLFRIGDAVESRNIHAAVFDGLRFAMGIDGKPD